MRPTAAPNYGDTPLPGSGAELFDRMSQLLKATHNSHLPYEPFRNLYPWVDLRPDTLMNQSIYSGKDLDPETLIKQDIEVARELEDFTQMLKQDANYASPAKPVSEHPFNCEHVVPQSWFQEGQPMKVDLHHLFACDPKCNSYRGNHPYFDFPVSEKTTMEECGRQVGSRFEPQAGKGPVARATLYFLLRYPGTITAHPDHYTQDSLRTLLSWHVQHPATVYERHRNAAIQELQGNRNPLINFLQLSETVDFTRGLG